MTKRIIIGIAVVILVGAGVAIFVFMGGGGIKKGQSVRLEFVQSETRVFVGQPFDVGISFSNISAQILKDVKLAITLPDEVSATGAFREQRVIEETIGDLGPGSIGQRSVNLLASGNGQLVKNLKAKLRYASTGSKAQFEQEAELDISVGPPAITLDFTTPEKIFSGENFDMTLKYRNNTGQEFKDIRLKIDYPPTYKFQKASQDPSASNNEWTIPVIGKTGDGVITVTGSLIAPEQSFFTFPASLSTSFLGDEYDITTQTASAAIAVAPLSLQIVPQNDPNYVATIGSDIVYKLTYRNNSDTTLENITIQTSLIGELFDFATLTSNASFNSLKNSLTWVTANTPSLASLAPGEEGSVNFRISLRKEFPIRRIGDKNYFLKVSATIESPTVPENTSAEKTSGVANAETRVAGRVVLDARALFRDAASKILNNGPYPPRANQPTQYTIHWIITNYSTDVANVRVSTFLQSGSRWTGTVKSTTGNQPVYNAATGEVIWEIPSIPATRGVISPPTEAIFQIELTPAINQIGQEVELTSETKLEAQDNFVNLKLSSTDAHLTTNLPDDPTVANVGDRRVQP